MSAPDPALRASDTEREHVVAVLRDAVGEGRLTLTEAEDRIAAAYTAVHRADLAPLTADLPRADPPATAGLAATGRPDRRPDRRRPPLLPVVAVLLVVAWIASPLPFPWPILLVAFLVLRHRTRHRTT
ncbi:hypothetical protein FHS29_000035 [Saccharothrix tamanrassetensis]|uniref:DUF1707 domain-containing protein n=1 Tax=Saccharothrix tamanrassetensis TaxID=1051531 RepID=A0A841CBT6_9PSEU|nr:DUF1707 domain-containing protein [Saccharothrix tamanrassetensis]MBB5953465.1 hypothetical protein [Saccharothrix tamanrassetensis]